MAGITIGRSIITPCRQRAYICIVYATTRPFVSFLFFTRHLGLKIESRAKRAYVSFLPSTRVDADLTGPLSASGCVEVQAPLTLRCWPRSIFTWTPVPSMGFTCCPRTKASLLSNVIHIVWAELVKGQITGLVYLLSVPRHCHHCGTAQYKVNINSWHTSCSYQRKAVAGTVLPEVRYGVTDLHEQLRESSIRRQPK